MSKYGLFILLPFLFMPVVYAVPCDVSGFREECEMQIRPKPNRHFQSYAFCAGSYGYLTPAQFDQLTRYHRRGMNVVLKVDGELVDVECVPGRRLDLTYLD